VPVLHDMLNITRSNIVFNLHTVSSILIHFVTFYLKILKLNRDINVFIYTDKNIYFDILTTPFSCRETTINYLYVTTR